MRVLITGECLDTYLAKCHEALRTGLRRMFGARCFGPGYPAFDPALTTYAQIAARIFPEGGPDLVLTDWSISADGSPVLPYGGLHDAPGLKALVFGDYWHFTERAPERFARFIEEHIDIVLSYFPQPLSFFAGSPIASRLHCMLPSVDPAIFTDYALPKTYDVGFLAAGSDSPDPFYPERHPIHAQLAARTDLRYLHAPHPGWGRHVQHPLVGEGFSRAINSCRLFVTTSGRMKNPQPKYYEALASRTVLLADEPAGGKEMGLIDGVNYVRCHERNVLRKVDMLLANPELCERVADAGYQLAVSRHTCYSRAAEMLGIVSRTRRARAAGVRFPASDGVRLHIGCGQVHWDGYINIDVDPASSADLVMNMAEVPRLFAPDTVQEIAVIQTVYYLPIWEACQFFRDAYGILRAKGRLVMELPDIEKVAAKVQQHVGTDLAEYIEGVRAIHAFGLDTVERRENYAPTKFTWSRWHLTRELKKAGFREVQFVPPKAHVMPDGTPTWRDMRVEAVK